MSDPLPLYQTLATQTQEPTLDNQRFCSLIPLLEKEHWEYLYLLIYHHRVLEVGSSELLPYGSSLHAGGRNVMFNLNNLPASLQRIVKLYVQWVTGYA